MADWHTDEYPELRPGPPWVTQEMVAAQPAAVRGLLDSQPDGVAAVAAAIRDGGPVTVVGCGTSEHGAMAIAELLDAALGGEWPPRAVARQSLDAAERPQAGGVCIGVSHDGGTRATTLALEAAAAGGAETALVTNRPGGSASGPAAHLILTPVHDDSWCHTVAYTSAIAVGALLARELGLVGVDGARAEEVLSAGIRRRPAAAALTGAERVVTTGIGVDLVTARELALKIAEGARIPTAALQLETLLHGHLAGEDPRTAAVLVDTDPAADRIGRRAAMAAAALGDIGMPVLTLVPADEGLRGPLERLLAGAAALQTLTLALAEARGVNPDLIRREEEPYRRAGSRAEGDW